MLSKSVALLALPILAAVASPIIKRAPSDTDILQYALTLEHLENAFYSGALNNFTAADFTSAGFPAWVRPRFEQISEHEAAHVAFLTTVIGSNATKPCTYNFPYTDPKSFTALSAVLEGVGVTAYLGAAQYITNKEYLTAAGSILTTEARHAAWVASAVNGGTPWSGPLDVPLDLDEVYSLAAQFITGCPSSNPTLPVKAFPALAISSNAAPGASVTLTYNSSNKTESLVLFSGLTQTPVTINGGKATLPSNLTGTVYAVVSTNGTSVTDDNIVAGPAILVFPDNS